VKLFEITIQRKWDEGWPVVVEQSQTGTFLPVRNEGRLALDEDSYQEHLLRQDTPLDYGSVLGKALLRDQVRDAFARARTESKDDLRLLLFVEDDELKTLHWERLCAPLDGGWRLLALDQRVLLSLYLPAVTDRRFPPFGRRDLRALILVANPKGLEEYKLAPFDDAVTVAGVRAALDEIPCDVLADVPEAVGPPTLDALVERLTAERYTLLHVVSHGKYLKPSGDTVLYLAKATPDTAGKQVDPVSGKRLIDRLRNLRGARGLPHFTFLSVCESAKPEAERGLRGLGQRLVRELGMPAVLAMTEPVTISTAGALAETFYRHLREHGQPDRALAEATAGLADRDDITVPALYSRLGGRPLFSDTEGRDLTNLTAAEIDSGLKRMEGELPRRAPILLKEAFEPQAARLRGKLEAERVDLSQADRKEWDEALIAINALCDEALDLNFIALALGREPPDYDNRCPFPGLLAFGVRFLKSEKEGQGDREFFFGREKLIAQLERKLADHNFLSVLGPSGSGKSSLVLAGLIPALQESESGLRMAYMTPGFQPLAELETSLFSPTDGAIILVVDQFEELFTLCTDNEERRVFVDRLLSLSEDLRVVITMRADFWGDCAPYRALAEEMQAHQVLTPPMDHVELRRAVEQQASAVGLRFEGDLVYTMLDAVRDEPGAMPLLQHLLRQLWERRHGRWLLAAEYRAIGGVHQAIAHTAEKVYAQSLPEEQDRLQDIFVRLTWLDEDDAPGEDWRDTRRRVGMEELVPAGNDPVSTKALVTRLANDRLVVTSVNEVTGGEEVEVAHEALIRYWPRLRGWLSQDRGVLRLREGIRRAALEWQEHGKQDTYLVHREGRLKRTTRDLAKHPRLALNQLEQTYLDACWTLQWSLRLESVLLKVQGALARHEPIRPSWLAWLRSDQGCALIRQLEEPDAADLTRHSSRLASDKVVSLLGLYSVRLPDRSEDGGERFGPVAWSAASHSQPVIRQTAALALSALKPYPDAALDRLQSALEASAQGRHHRLREAELRGTLLDEDPDNEQLGSKLSLMDRLGVWRWRARRRVMRDRQRILWLAVGGGIGAGLGLGLLRGVIGALAGQMVGVQFAINFWWAWILGAALSLGITLAGPLLLDRPDKGEGTRPTGRAPRHPDRPRAVLAVCLGTIFFGLAHLVVAWFNGLRLFEAPLVGLLGFVAGLGLSLALYGQPRSGWHLGILRWLLRLAVTALTFVLTQAIFITAGGQRAQTLAIVRSGSYYYAQFLEFVERRWPWLLVECCAGWPSYLALIDAALVGIVLTIGITAGLLLAEDWLKHWRDLIDQSDD
jgi:energy-coupling factor transporter ATP-binding protein EcfA2